MVEVDVQYFQQSSSKHTEDMLIEEYHEVIAVFAWQGEHLFNQLIYEP